MLDSTTTRTTAIADEDRWEVPAHWWARALPSRGLGPATPVTILDSTAIDTTNTAATQRDSIMSALRASAAAGAGELSEAGYAALCDPAAASPLGAAVISAIVESAARVSRPDEGRSRAEATVDAWVRGRGVGFAATAAVLRSGLTVEAVFDRSSTQHRHTVRSLPSDDPGNPEFTAGLVRVRAHLAVATEPEYRSVVALLGELRSRGASAFRVATSFLAPTERDWVTADIAGVVPDHRYTSPYALLIASVDTRAELETLIERLSHYPFLYSRESDLLLTALTRLGPEGAEPVGRMVREYQLSSEAMSRLTDLLSWLPSDAAFTALLARADERQVPQALAAAAQRFPHRAVRLLHPAMGRPVVRHALRTVAITHPELVAALPDGSALLPPTHRTVVSPEELPEVLRNPPWQRARKKVQTVVLADVVAPVPDGLDWRPGEREEWAGTEVWLWEAGKHGWPKLVANAVRTQDPMDYRVPRILSLAPEELVRPHLARLSPGRLWNAEAPLRRLLARCGDDALPYVLRAARANPTSLAHVLAPVTGTAAAQLMMRWTAGKTTRQTALDWFDRHVSSALPIVIGAALAKPGKDRTLAEATLRVLAERGHRETIDASAAALGERARTAVAAALAADPLHQLPTRIPTPPKWLVPELLPAVGQRDSAAVLPTSAVRDICTMLALCGPNGDYAGLAQVIEFADSDSLAEFAWSLFELWQLADYPAKDGWVLHALGLLGNDETARRIGPLIRAWPGQSANARAVSALNVLTAIGTDVALMQLHGIAEKVKFNRLRSEAWRKISDIADGLGLTPEQLADRLVPDFGLGADGTLVLDYGTRGFVVGFDEQLKPTVSDAVRGDDGWQPSKPRKSLPKPGAKDDEELATASYKSFTALKRDVKFAAAEQLRRFEQAMVRGRRWTAAEHRRLFVEHPLLSHPTRRLVWATFDTEGAVTGSFRLAEDRSYADADDNPVTLADDILVGIAHPVHLGEELAAWGELFADYEILQPFPQLQREVHVLGPEQAASCELPGWHHATVPTGRVLGLSRFGWERGEPMDGGVSCDMFRDVGDNLLVVIDLDPGIIAGDALEWGEQTVTVRLMHADAYGTWPRDGKNPRFADLEPVAASELLRELHLLTA
ncbi:DUF4132 domain-containing protein [Nocardia sp. CC227C]|uniref:DUF4132 domain-containing protein n=1 Tax=Nocardia sp. CC227C TaxID=3044562 RepID=UPI00278C1BDB|nr:DUF4132 domain-containing protein [Nocardia sp. CC227C]